MKLVIFRGSTHEADGATRMLVHLANELQSRGHTVTVLRWKHRRIRTFYSLDANISLEHVKPVGTGHSFRHSRQHRKSRGRTSSPWTWDTASVRDPVGRLLLPALELDTLSGQSAISHLYYRIWRRYYRRTIRQYRIRLSEIAPDVVLTFFTRAHFYVAEVCKELGLPVLCSMHSDPDAYSKRLGNEFDHLIRTIPASRITVLDEGFLPKLLHASTGNLEVAPNWIDVGRFRTDPQNPRSKRIISVGRLVDIKNHELLIDAWARLAHSHPDWTVNIFGDGPLKARLQGRIDRLDLSSSVRICEPREAIEVEYSNSSIHVMPSLREGFGLALVEAMAAGLPSVVLDVCNPPARLVRESQAGLVCAPNPSALAEGVRQLMASEELRTDMGARGITYAAQFADRSVIDRFEAWLESASHS